MVIPKYYLVSIIPGLYLHPIPISRAAAETLFLLSSPLMESDANTSSDPSAPPNSCSMVVNNSNVGDHHHRNGHTRATQMLPPQYPIRYNNNSHGNSGGGNGFGGSMGSSPLLIRQTTSPPGFFSQFITNSQTGGGYGIESYAMVDHGATNGDSSSTSMTLKNHPRFLSGSPSLGSSMSRLTEVSEHEHSAKVGNDATSIGDNSFLTSRSFPACGSWNDSSSHFSDIFSTIKREPHNDHKLYDPSQRGITSSRLGSTTPSRQLSLPKNSSEMLSMEKLLQLHDSVPCKLRAKRGCATHPRSIAERVRRTRISEKMRKLQELVPNMDKQTNTAEMLDLAVDYIKSLQKQYKALNDNHAQCNCSASQQ